MNYIKLTIGLPLILSIDKSSNIKWHVDTAFSVHMYMRRHTGGFMTMGIGGAYVQKRKQKLNTKSSTEADLVGVDDVMTKGICTRYFLKYQGQNIHGNIIYQDNQIAIKSENNSRQSSSKRTRHINIRYYFITDRITTQEVSMELCPTLEMIREYFTKALQGSQFCHFCDIILGIHEDEIPSYNEFGRAFIEEQKIKLERNKEEDQKNSKLAGN